MSRQKDISHQNSIQTYLKFMFGDLCIIPDFLAIFIFCLQALLQWPSLVFGMMQQIAA